VENGWWNDRQEIEEACSHCGIDHRPNLAIELLGLCHSELSEAVEAARKHPVDKWRVAHEKDTMVREMAGTIVRLMDMAEYFDLPLAEAIEEEIAHNKTRGFKHGGKAA
jgi:hypothetical protein